MSVKFSQFSAGGTTITGDIVVGLRNGINTQFTLPSALALPVILADGGTGAALTASNGGIFYSTATAGAILSGTPTAHQLLLSGASVAPLWSTSTYPTTNSVNTLLYASSVNAMAELPTANSSVLATSAGGVPSLTQTLPSAVQVSTGSLNSGTLASSSTFWRGDGTWSSPTGNITNIVNGRLTLTSGTPVTTGDVTAATTIYFTPYLGNTITIYNGAGWVQHSFNEVSLGVPGSANTMYDVFGSISGGNLVLSAVAWTNDTTRATALVLQNGVYCESGILTNLYLGSFRTKTAGQCNDSAAFRHLWNYYNRITKQMLVNDSSTMWNYSTGTYRQANANAADQLDLVQGVQEDSITCRVNSTAFGTVATSNAGVGIGINSTTVNSATSTAVGVPGVSAAGPLSAEYIGYPGVGRTFLPWLEYASGSTVTWEGNNGIFLSGISGTARF